MKNRITSFLCFFVIESVYYIFTFLLFHVLRVKTFLFGVFLGKLWKKVCWEKLGQASARRLQGKLVWIHAVSVGELNAAVPVIRNLHDKFPNMNFLVTTHTQTSANLFLELNLPNTIHQYFPLDTPQGVYRFLDFWHLDYAIFMESELWPNLLNALFKYRIPAILLNARISKSSAKRWRCFIPLLKKMLNCFNKIFFADSYTSDFFVEVVPEFKERFFFFENIKYFSEPLEYNEQELVFFRKFFTNKKICVCASTHEGEESLLLENYYKIKKSISNIVLIIIPRHPKRLKSILEIGKKLGLKCDVYSKRIGKNDFNVSTNSENKKEGKDLEIFIVDAIGRLGLFYRLADAVFVGGSLIPYGGQNLFEPIQLGCPTVIGPYYYNFWDMVKEAKKAGCLNLVEDIDELVSQFRLILPRKQSQKDTEQERQKIFVAEKKRNIKKLFDVIERDIEEKCRF